MRRVLYAKLAHQSREKPVELLSLIDNMKRSIGMKRQALVSISHGSFITFVDDDDDVTDEYIDEILKAIEANPDTELICPQHLCTLDDHSEPTLVRVGMDYTDEQFRVGETNYRRPGVSSVWRNWIARLACFPDSGYGEDAEWAQQAMRAVTRWVTIDKPLHHYRWRADVTEAPVPKEHDAVTTL